MAVLRALLAGTTAFIIGGSAAAVDGAPEGQDWQTQTQGAQCFAADQLAAVEGERSVRKGNHTFDKPAPARDLEAFQPVPAGLRGSIRRVTLPAGRKLIALTFDLCEQPGEIAGYDGEIVDYLRRQGVKATFFAGGKWMRSHAERALQLMADPLFEIGNHSEAHRNLRLLSGPALTDEIVGPQRAFETLRENAASRQCRVNDQPVTETVAPRMGLFRFPYGACNDAAMEAVNDNGLLAIQWDLSVGDPSPQQSAKAIASAMMQAKAGSILIAHANGRGFHTREALPVAIPALRAKGFEFVTVSELLAVGTPQIATECYDNRPGDTNRYDHLLAHHKASPQK